MRTIDILALIGMTAVIVGIGICIRIVNDWTPTKFIEEAAATLGVSALVFSVVVVLIIVGYGFGCFIKHFNS